MELYEKSLNTLELPSVLALLADEAVSDPAKEKALELRPSKSEFEVKKRMSETSSAKKMMTVKGSPSFSGVKDVRSSLSRADMGGVLNTRELLDIAGVLQTARLVRGYVGNDNIGKTDIDHLFYSLQANRFLEDKINGSITAEDEIADAASAELADIRRKIRAASARVREALQKIISSPTYAKALQEPIITTRSDRYVVPVKADHKGSVPGLVHDVSSSGATLFIEPMAAVKANNELRELRAKEKLEIERILAELSADCAEHREDITRDFDILVTLDFIFAKAKLSYKYDGEEPRISERELVLRRARHPLLPKDSAVPIDIELGGEYDTLVITGPNTGGKTVSIKTMGLLSAMALCGLHIPTADGSCIPVFRAVLADIGDEQSIEQSLSTFSSHMTNIVRIIEECGEGTLLLLDELGGGTDPTEGAALAMSVIEYARSMGSLVAATTHYAELKVYATNTAGVQNASCEFDVETLRPTYRLLVGIPGKSNAFAISARLGLPENIIEDARKRIGTESASFEATIEKLEQERRKMEKYADEAETKLREAEKSAERAAKIEAELNSRLEKAEEKSRREAQRILDDARRTADSVFAELDEMKKKQQTDDDHRRVNEARAELRRRINESAQKYASPSTPEPEPEAAPSREIRPGDTVMIRSMGIKAEVISISPDKNLELQAGIMRVNAKPGEVYLLENEKKKQPKSSGSVSAARTGFARVGPELDIRGMMTDEAIPIVERYIDNAVMSKLTTVTIIHGKGTGALRAAVQDCLKHNRQVKKYRLGRYGEGETGVTVVELK